MSRKETLIKTLRGSVEQLEGLAERFEGVDVFDENGYVDTEFVTSILDIVNKFQGATALIMKRVGSLFGPDIDYGGEKRKADKEGAKWSVEEILRHCTLENGVMKLPNVQLNKKSYAEAKKWIEEAGGTWTGGKVQGFTFPFNPERVFAILQEGKRCNLQQEFQFFATPPEVADWLVELAGGISENDTVLEPSAGSGALISAIHRSCPSVIVDYYELMPENRELLAKMKNIAYMGEDFAAETVTRRYSKIIANPPFSKNQDIDHVLKMYAVLKPGGVLAAIMSKHWRMASESKCTEFRSWLDDMGAHVYDIEGGAFKESGTGVETCAVIITKNK